MNSFLDLPTIVIIVVALVILWRLRSVLGTRTGNERPPFDPFQPRQQTRKPDDTDDKVVTLPPRRAVDEGDAETERRARKLEAELDQFSHGDASLRDGLKAIADADPAFAPKSFLEGAKVAYEMIVTAFAQGDRKTLRNLLEKDVFEGFDRAIAERESAGQKVDFTFVGLPGIELSGAELDKRNANVTIRFRAEVVSATRDSSGEVVEGDAEQVVTIADEWTFARPVRSRDPNWKLVATNQID
ncbi:MAG TPA: Tim44/TimA family putative adaptor protein [Devosiaceae bacterium]